MLRSRKRVVGFFHPKLHCLIYTSDHDATPHTLMARAIHLFGNMEKQSISSFMKELHNINRISLGECYIKNHVARLEPKPEFVNELECRSFCHNKLKTIEIEVKTPYKHALWLIRLLLANSSSLEILKFKVDPVPSVMILFLCQVPVFSGHLQYLLRTFANADRSSPSIGAVIYASRFSSNLLRSLRRSKRSKMPHTRKVLPLLPRKPSEPDFTTKEK
ncbi:unnamed protein product [Lupinus luteus]|uniref:FBD domain-containing protein n=1 Tax=Lupinus luteus TaxID=3873 RepID=A0AAV1X2P4_LUPLU